ncbi:unnamed protein product [Cercospora beticola]|nr:unnamed protein product [Cercospora beticola]
MLGIGESFHRSPDSIGSCASSEQSLFHHIFFLTPRAGGTAASPSIESVAKDVLLVFHLESSSVLYHPRPCQYGLLSAPRGRLKQPTKTLFPVQRQFSMARHSMGNGTFKETTADATLLPTSGQ